MILRVFSSLNSTMDSQPSLLSVHSRDFHSFSKDFPSFLKDFDAFWKDFHSS